jgi:protein phosphatase
VTDTLGDPVRSYRPGGWFGILGERAVVILPPTEKPRVAGLWELVDSGEITPAQAGHHPERHVITRALGGPRLEPADSWVVPVSEIDRLLLCTDGISGLVGDDRIEAILTGTSDPRDAADGLVAAALEAGGDDNATAVVVDVVGLVPDQTYDSEQQRASLEQKLGALP